VVPREVMVEMGVVHLLLLMVEEEGEVMEEVCQVDSKLVVTEEVCLGWLGDLHLDILPHHLVARVDMNNSEVVHQGEVVVEGLEETDLRKFSLITKFSCKECQLT